MKTMSVRDVRQKWPEAERLLALEGEIVVTRDAKPVAKIIPFPAPKKTRRPRMDFEKLRKWRERFWKTQPPQPSTDEWLARDRAERCFIHAKTD